MKTLPPCEEATRILRRPRPEALRILERRLVSFDFRFNRALREARRRVDRLYEERRFYQEYGIRGPFEPAVKP